MTTPAPRDRTPLPAPIETALERARTAGSGVDRPAQAARLRAALDACLERLGESAGEWVRIACTIKRIAPGSPAVADEISGGPIAVARALHVFARSTAAVALGRLPTLPGPVRRGVDGSRVVRVLPALPFDRVLFTGYRCDVVVDDGPVQELPAPRRGLAVVLGAGNVTSIAPVDLLTKLCRDGLPAIVKQHPLFAPLLPILERVFAPLDVFGCAFVDGDPRLGAALAMDARVTDVHLTGAASTFTRLVAGNATRAVPARLTAELGSVTPVIVVPGRWTDAELSAQVENVAAMLVGNGGFNCVAAKVLVTAREWPRRSEFLARLRSRLAAIERRAAWHPGAVERFERFAGHAPDDAERLPWTLIDDLADDADLPAFREEAFGPILWEVPVDGDALESFLSRAVAFCNGVLAGDLAVMLLASRATLRGDRPELERAVAALRYGTVAINAWAALGFAWMCAPWGGAPGNTLASPGSGIGFVHEPWFLRAPEKTVIRGPAVPWPTPPWWPRHRAPATAMASILASTLRPSWARLPGLAAAAWSGIRSH